MQLSKYVTVYRREGTVALYQSITQSVAFCTEAEFEELFDYNPATNQKIYDLVWAMRDKRILIPAVFAEEDEQKVIQGIRDSVGIKPDIELMYLILTEGCNLRCKYCFVEGTVEDKCPQTMSEETAFKAIDLFAKVISGRKEDDEPPTIIFFGGEPLVNKKVFIAATKYIDDARQTGKLPATQRIIIVTNGTIMDEEILNTIKRYKVEMSVSIDGPEEFHDTNRVYRSGRGSFAKVRETIKTLQAEGIDFFPSCTITNSNVQAMPYILKWLMSEFGCKAFTFNPMLGIDADKFSNKQYVENFAQGLINCFKIGRTNGIYEDRMMRKLVPFVTGTMHLKDCNGCGLQMVVAPNGKIGPCQGFIGTKEYYTGDLNDPEYLPQNDPTFHEWYNRSPINQKECVDCSLLGCCGGGCPYNAHLRKGSIWERDEPFCKYVNIVSEWFVWDLYEQQNKALGCA